MILRRIPFAFILPVLAIACAVPAGCAGGNPHFMPRMHPLFGGLDEQKLGHGAKAMLAEAKADFLLVRHGKDPQYAKYASTIPYTHSRVFEGRGYQLTMVRKDEIARLYVGPKIVIKAAITGGQPFAYDEVDCLGD
jgi:hypothetical protein